MPDCKPETALRILRSYRICLLHEYCNTLLKDTYLETVKIQTARACSALRTKASLFPRPKGRGQRLFTVRLDAEVELLSHASTQFLNDGAFADDGHPTSVGDILSGQVCNHSIFYVPSTKEVLQTDRFDSDSTPQLHREMTEAYPLNVATLDKDIKAFAALPTSTLHDAQEQTA